MGEGGREKERESGRGAGWVGWEGDKGSVRGVGVEEWNEEEARRSERKASS